MNKKLLIAPFALVIIVILILVFVSQPKTKNINTAQPTQVDITQNDTTQIKEVLQKEVPQKGGVKSFEVLQLSIKNNFAFTQIKPLDVETDNAMVFLEKKNGKWEIIWGPGTSYSPEDPLLKSIPKELLPY